jgi:hypothetical protein
MKKKPRYGENKSHGLKEYPERKYHVYISNGAFIAAALHLGLPFENKVLMRSSE